jgi:hypothetical protein
MVFFQVNIKILKRDMASYNFCINVLWNISEEIQGTEDK